MKPFALVFRYARKYILQLIVTVVSMLLLVGVQLIVPWIIRRLIQTITEQNTNQTSFNLITWLAAAALIVYLLKAVLQFLRSYMPHLAGWSVVADIRRHIYDHVQRLSLRFYEDKQVGQLMSRVINDTDLFEALISHALPDLIVNVLTLIGVSLVLFNLNWQLALLSLVPIPLIIVALSSYARYVRPAFVARQKELGDLNALLNDNLSGIREIKVFTREEAEVERVGNGIERYRRSLLGALKLMATFQPFVDFTSSLGVLIVIYFGGRLALNNVLPVADLVAFFLYLDLFYQPIRNLSGAWEQLQNALAGADRVRQLLEEEPEPHNRPEAVELKAPVRGDIQFRDVSFQYVQGELILDRVNLEIPAKSIVALVGPTGVGKTTLVSLIPRFYDVTAGSILLDGQDIRELKLESLRSQISFVLQDVFLFYGTVRDNILLGNPKASNQAVIDAAKVANAHEFIMELPDGYDTLIGERGVKLSGGQKQRLSIARAVLKNAPILILDEATSSVDPETELLIHQALKRLMAGRTTIIIAHRLSTIHNADKIVVLEGKHIAEMGTHDELMRLEGLYYRLATIQQEFEREIEGTEKELMSGNP